MKPFVELNSHAYTAAEVNAPTASVDADQLIGELATLVERQSALLHRLFRLNPRPAGIPAAELTALSDDVRAGLAHALAWRTSRAGKGCSARMILTRSWPLLYS